MTTSRKLLWLMADRGVRLLTTFGNTAIVARALGPEQFGKFAQGLLVFAIADSVCSLGLPTTIAARIASSDATCPQRLLYATVGVRTIAGFFAYCSIVTYIWLRFGTFSSEWVIIGMLTALFASQWTFGEAYLQGLGEPHRAAIAKVSVALLFMCCRFIWWQAFNGQISAWVAFFIIEQLSLSFVILSVSYWASRRQESLVPASGSNHMPSIRREAALVWISQISSLIYMRVDQMVLATIASPSILASYALAVQLVEQAYTIPVIMNSLAIRDIGSAYRKSADAFRNRMVKQYRWGILLSAACVVALVLFVGPLIRFLYGEKYESSIQFTRVLAISIMFVTLGTLQISEVVIRRSPGVLVWKNAAAALMCAPAAYIGWQLAGPIGLAIAAVVVQAFSCVGFNYWVDRNALLGQWHAFRSLIPLPRLG